MTGKKPGDATHRVECWARSLARVPSGPQPKVVRRLEWLVVDDAFDDLRVETWPAAIPADRSRTLGDHERTVYDRLRTFERWAERTSRDLGPGFDTRHVGTEHEEAPIETVRTLPVVAVAEFRGDEVVRVTPSVGDGDLDTVEDHLEDLCYRLSGPSENESVPLTSVRGD